MESLTEKANVLIEALPYIRTFFGRTFVIKYGGSAMTDPQLKKAVALDLILLRYVGVNPVVVHGGGPEISRFMRMVGKEPVFVNGMRVTDAETMELVQMVLVGKINQELVALVNRYGGKAVGLSGHDGKLVMARKRQLPPDAEEGGGAVDPPDLGFVGDVDSVNPETIRLLTQEGYIPIVSTVASGPEGESYNINADVVAGELAVALQAEKLIMLTDVEGIYGDPEDKSTLISALPVDQARRMIMAGRIEGGMIPKVEACMRAVENGVARTHIIDGRAVHSLLLEIFTDRGIGTMVVA